MIQKIIKWLFKKFVNPDLTDALMEKLHVVNNSVDIALMESMQRGTFLANCHSVFHNPAFVTVISNFVKKQMVDTFEKGDTETHFLCGKIGILTTLLIQKEFGRYSAQYEELQKPKEEFNPHEI